MAAGDPWRRRVLGSPPETQDPSPPADRRVLRLGAQPSQDPNRRVSLKQVPVEGHAPPTGSYRLAAFALLAWGLALALAAYDEYWSLPHAASINAALFLTSVLVVMSLSLTLKRARAWRRVHTMPTPEIRDKVTGLPNDRYLHLRLDDEVVRAQRYDRPLALVIVGVNSLQSVNEQYGWDCGDQVLRHMAAVLEDRRHGSDTVARLAEDRFAIILPECDEPGACAFVERLEQHLSRSPARVQVDGKPFDLWVGICSGVAQLDSDTERASELMSGAAADLQAAKEERNSRRRRWLSA